MNTAELITTNTDFIVSLNPATGEEVGRVHSYSVAEAQIAIEKAGVAQKRWEAAGLAERINTLKRFRDVLVDHMDELCHLISLENGKPMQEAMETEVLPMIDLTDYFVKRAPKILADQKISMHLLKHRKSYLHYRPRGVVLVISPWNFPFTIPGGSIVMALLAGNAVIHKPASLTPLIAEKIRELFDHAGLEKDIYQVLPSPGRVASEMIKMGVDYVNFTGSTSIGKRVAALCGELLIPCSMELGGKDPMIVCDDADLNQAVGAAVWGGLANAGQVCASVERIYAHESIYDEFVTRVTREVSSLRVGDPSLSEQDMGPMVDPNQLDIVEAQVNEAISKEATVKVGGKRLDGPGQFFEPTVLVDVDDTMKVVSEETFGPVIPIMKYSFEADVIRRANDSNFGLNAYVFTKDIRKGNRIARQLEAGTVMINEALITHGMPETPWQGVKESGVGKVHSDQGLRDLSIAYHINEPRLNSPVRSPFWYPYSEKGYKRLKSLVHILFGKGAQNKLKSLGALLLGWMI